MFAKLLITILFATVTAAALLGLRQQRMQSMHDMARLHDQIDQLRRSTWDLQVRISANSAPEALRQALERSNTVFESANTVTLPQNHPNWSPRMVEVFEPRSPRSPRFPRPPRFRYPEQAIR